MNCLITKNREELFDQYECLFKPSNNRNAASHIWTQHILNHSQNMSQSEFIEQAKGFCTASGSPISRSNEFVHELSTTHGSKSRVSINYCCWPCACDIQDANTLLKLHIHPTTVPIQNNKVVHTNYIVIDDPCKHPDDIPSEAPAIKCVNNTLQDAKHIETPIGPKVVIGFAFDTSETINQPSEKCEARKLDGYRSGMGTIFRNLLMLD